MTPTPTKEQIGAEMETARSIADASCYDYTVNTIEIATALATARLEGRNKALDEAAGAIRHVAQDKGNQVCCGVGLGSPPECCGHPNININPHDAEAAIIALKEIGQ